MSGLIECIENAGYTAKAYSGRGMYGEQCVGVVTDKPLRALVRIAVEAERLAVDVSLLETVHTDRMGHDSVLYWPRATIVEQQ